MKNPSGPWVGPRGPEGPKFFRLRMLRFDWIWSSLVTFTKVDCKRCCGEVGVLPPSPVLRSGRLEAVTRTCLTQTGPSLASNSFSTLRGSPLMSLDGTAIPFGHLLGETGSDLLSQRFMFVFGRFYQHGFRQALLFHRLISR